MLFRRSTSGWPHCRWATTSTPKASLPKLRSLCPESQPDGPTGASWRCAKETTMRRRERFRAGARSGSEERSDLQPAGMLESQRGNSAQALADLRKAVELNPQNLRAIYQLAEETERQGDANSEAEFQNLMQKILAAQPDNLAALLELCRIAAKRGDAAHCKVGGRANQRSFLHVAAGSAASTCRCAGSGFRLTICARPPRKPRSCATC